MAEEGFVDIVRGEGSLVFDAEGKDYVDGMANLWLCQVGHGRAAVSYTHLPQPPSDLV